MKRSLQFMGWVLGVLLLSITLACAQTDAEKLPNYAEWNTVAQRIETALSGGETSDSVLEGLRAELTEWRQKFETAQDSNASRIATVREQIAVLGPPPADGETESEDVAARRQELNRQLTELRAPVIAAEEAYKRANGLVGEIDTTLRERQTDQLLAYGSSPLNITNWPRAAEEIYDAGVALASETKLAVTNPTRQRLMIRNLPAVILLAIIGIVLIARGRRWMKWVMRHANANTIAKKRVWDFLLSLGVLIVPTIGVVALSQAFIATGFVGLRGEVVLYAFTALAIGVFAAKWVGDRIFPRDNSPSLMYIDSYNNPRGHRLATYLAVIYLIWSGIKQIHLVEEFSLSTQAILSLPLLILASIGLLRMADVLKSVPAEADEDEAASFRQRIYTLVARALTAVALIGPVLALIGYFTASITLVYQTILTLGLVGIVMILRDFAVNLYAAVMNRENPKQGLVPVLMSFGFSMLALPFGALIWGARTTDISELWTRFKTGISVGDVQISPTVFLTFAIVFALGYMLTRLVQGALRSTILPQTKMDIGAQTAIVSGTGYIGIFLAALIAISVAGIDLSSLAIVAGALSVGIGFGLQNIVSNFVSGIILLIERPISEGDWVEVGPHMGIVKDISVRSTRIETFDRTDVIVPNADFVSSSVINWTRGNNIGRIIVPVGVAYGTDTKRVQAILEEIVNANPMVLLEPAPAVHFKGFGASSLDFEIRAILRDINMGLSVRTELNHEIAARFTDEKIEIPFPQTDLWLRNPETLKG